MQPNINFVDDEGWSMIKCVNCTETFSTEADAKTHFINTHGNNRCQLCNREGAAHASNYCLVCRTNFLGETNTIDGMDTEIRNLQKRAASLQSSRKSLMISLKTRFIENYNRLFCIHDLPKDSTCLKCEKFEAREVKIHRPYISVMIHKTNE